MTNALIALLLLMSFEASARITTAICQVQDSDGTVVLKTKPLYPIRSSSLYRVREDFFLELRFDAMGNFVRVYELKMPHSPWTFGETMFRESDIRLSSEGEGDLLIDSVLPGGTLSCQTSR